MPRAAGSISLVPTNFLVNIHDVAANFAQFVDAFAADGAVWVFEGHGVEGKGEERLALWRLGGQGAGDGHGAGVGIRGFVEQLLDAFG